MSRGFILLEIIISVMLLSFAGIALLKVNSNEKKLYTIAKGKLEFSKKMSIVLNQHSINLDKKKISLYDAVKRKYRLKNDDLIKVLKNTDVEYKQKYSSTLDFSSKENNQSLALLIDEITVSTKDGTSLYLTVKK